MLRHRFERRFGFSARRFDLGGLLLAKLDDVVDLHRDLLERRPIRNADQRLAGLLKTPIDDLELSVRSVNSLKNSNIRTLGDLVRNTQDQLLKVRNVGDKAVEESTRAVAQALERDVTATFATKNDLESTRIALRVAEPNFQRTYGVREFTPAVVRRRPGLC